MYSAMHKLLLRSQQSYARCSLFFMDWLHVTMNEKRFAIVFGQCAHVLA